MQQADAGKAGAPWLTLALLAVLIIVFCLELTLGFDQHTGLLQPSQRTLAALGGSNRNLVAGGEWFRVISAPFLHANLLHLSVYGLALLCGGSVLERLLGRAWFAAIYTTSTVTGGLMSLAINSPTAVSVGASGAIMGVMASLFVASLHFPPGPARTRLLTAALMVLVLSSLVPVFTAITGQRVDFGAHLGGTLGGAFTTLVLLLLWPRSESLPRLRWLAAAIGAAGLITAAVSAWNVHGSFVKAQHEMELQAMLIPDSQFPRTDAEWKAQVDNLAARYPHDPRPRLYRGITLLDAGDLAGAERELRDGLGDAQTFKDVLPPQVEALLRTNLASTLNANRQTAEAKSIAEPVCRPDRAETRSLRSRLRRLGLCE
jgi:rhomboid protease GluP